MSAIRYIYEPRKLYLVWHASSAQNKVRRIVGEIVQSGSDFEFSYLHETADFAAAVNEGFFGYPAFDIECKTKTFKGALDIFVKRLPPSKREDFPDYLEQYCLPRDFSGSSFALLGYTGAKLASDTFELYADYEGAQAPLDIVTELAGANYYKENISLAQVGDQVDLIAEPENEHDANAIRVVHEGNTIGYINRFVALTFNNLEYESRVETRIIKITIKDNSVKAFLLIKYR